MARKEVARKRGRATSLIVSVLLPTLLCACSAAAQATVKYNKFLLFFQLLDQSGDIADEFAAVDGDLCKMKSIKCEAGQVVSMDFSGQSLVGELAKDNYIYEQLPALRVLDLSNNKLGYGVAPIPNDIHKLVNIEYLDLSNNQFTGEMPTFVIDKNKNTFKKLKHIDLSDNQLRGRLRWNWADLEGVTFIDLSGNNLSGALPPSWYSSGGMTGVATLDVSRNNQDICGDDDAGETAFAARGVTFSCRADGATDPAPPPVAVVANGTLTPLFDEDGEPITGTDGKQIFLGPDGEPLVDYDGNSIVDETGNFTSDVNGNPVARNPDGSVKTDANGNPIFVDEDGNELVDGNGNSLHGPNGQFMKDEDGNPIAVGPDGNPVTDSEGNPVFLGPDGEPLVTTNGTSQHSTDGKVMTDANGNPVLVSPDGTPVTDDDGSPVFVGPDGAPLVDTEGGSIVGPSGEIVTDVNGNPVATNPDGSPVTDPAGNPVFTSPDGTPLVDEGGTSIIGPSGNITSDQDGNPVATNPDGTPAVDDEGNPIFIGPDGNPIVDSEGSSTRGWDGAPLTDEDGSEIPPSVFAPNGTMIPGDSLGGEPVYGGDGKPIFDANGNPVVIPAGGKKPPTNTTAGPEAFGPDTALPNGEPAGGLQTPSCVSPLPFEDPPVSCPGDPEATAVCLSPDQLVLNATRLMENGTFPPNLFGCDANVTSETYFHQYFAGETLDGVAAREMDTLARMRDVLGGKPVNVVSWKPVYGEAAAGGSATPRTGNSNAAPGPPPQPAGVQQSATSPGEAEASQRRLLARDGASLVALGIKTMSTLRGTGRSAPASQRTLQQVEGQDIIGVMGYFLVQGGDVADLETLVSEFSGVGQTIDSNGRPVLSQRQTSDIPSCGGTNTARTWVLSALAVCIGILLAGLVITFITIARLKREARTGHRGHGGHGGDSNTTITPSGTGRGPWSDDPLMAISPRSSRGGRGRPRSTGSPGSASGAPANAFGAYSKVAVGSFGSVIGATGRFGEDGSDSPSSRDNDGGSQQSLGKSMLTLRDGVPGVAGRRSGRFESSGSGEGRLLDASGREAGSLTGPMSNDSDSMMPTSASDAAHVRSDSSGGSSNGSGSGSGQMGPIGTFTTNGGGSSSGGGAAPLESGFSLNGPLPPIAEHNTHSDLTHSDTNDSSMGDGSRAGSVSAAAVAARVAAAAAAGLPHGRSALGPAGGESSMLMPGGEPTSSMAEPSEDISSHPVAGMSASTAATVGASYAATAAVAARSAKSAGGSSAGTSHTFHTVSITSWDSSASAVQSGRAGTGAADMQTTRSSSQNASLSTNPTPTSADGGGMGAHGAGIDQGLVSITQLGSIGILSNRPAGQADRDGSEMLAQDPALAPVPTPSSQTSSSSEARALRVQRQPEQGGSSMALFPGAGPSWMFGSRGNDVMDAMGPDAHVDTQQFNSAGMLDSLQHGGRLQPTAEEDEDGDVEVTADAHDESTVLPGNVPGNTSAVLDGSHLLPGDTSMLQSLSNNPTADMRGPSGVLRQAYDLIDSMGPVADHTVVPSDHLDTGVMISVPQQPAHGSPNSSAQNLDFVAAAYSPDGPGSHAAQLPPPTGADHPAPAPVGPTTGESGHSSEEATGRLEVPASLEEMLASQSHDDESAFRSIGSHALYRSYGRSAPSSQRSDGGGHDDESAFRSVGSQMLHRSLGRSGATGRPSGKDSGAFSKRQRKD